MIDERRVDYLFDVFFIGIALIEPLYQLMYHTPSNCKDDAVFDGNSLVQKRRTLACKGSSILLLTRHRSSCLEEARTFDQSRSLSTSVGCRQESASPVTFHSPFSL